VGTPPLPDPVALGFDRFQLVAGVVRHPQAHVVLDRAAALVPVEREQLDLHTG
jgi:hypothetical protein